jgi:DNA-binding IclR family transcriptional regulator
MWTVETRTNEAASDGTQSIERAVTVLRVLATRERFGWGLTELATACKLKKATTHRILSRLERERLVHKRQGGDRYFLGALVGELAISIPGFTDFAQQTQEFLTEVARRQALVGVLSLRSGDHFVVAGRVASSRLKAELNEIGARRPLVTTAGGVAILVGLPDEEQQRIVEANTLQLTLRGRSNLADAMAMWERSRALGYGTNFGDIAPGVNAVAVPVVNRHGEPFASITVAGPEAQLTEARCHELVASLQHHAKGYAELAARVHPDLYDCAAPAER